MEPCRNDLCDTSVINIRKKLSVLLNLTFWLLSLRYEKGNNSASFFK